MKDVCRQDNGHSLDDATRAEQKEVRGNNEESKGYINKGEEDEMEIRGFIEFLPYKILTWVFIVFTAGLLRLVFHWWPMLMLYSTHRPCNLARATKLLITDTFEKRFKSSFIKSIRRISLNLVGDNNLDLVDNSIKMNSESGLIENNQLKSTKIKINLADGSSKELTEFRVVIVKKLRYIWINEKQEFVKLVGIDENIKYEDFHTVTGYSRNQQYLKLMIYGFNEITVPIVSIPVLVGLEVLNPFYIFQLYALTIWLSDEYYYYAAAIVIMSFFGISSSVLQTHQNQKKLLATVHSSSRITVKRLDNYEDVSTSSLVPGDVIVIPARGCIMHCDAVLLNGKCIVNESMLTGESVPVTKSAVPSTNIRYNITEDNRHTLYCGTNVIQTRYYGNEKVLAVVIRTGYLTSKGSLVRCILYPPPADFKFDHDSYKFIWFLAGVGFIGFIYTIYTKVIRGLHLFEVMIKALDLFTIVIPPALPAAMTVGKLHALETLKKQKISCINSRIINVTGSLNCVCFDKTGTLTEDGLDMWGVIPVVNRCFDLPCRDPTLLQHKQLLYGMATCHSLTLIDNQISGDPLDVKMFESIGWTFEEPSSSDEAKYDLLVPAIVYPSKNNVNNHLDEVEFGILQQYQFSSKLQRMTVLCRQLGSADIVAYCKGSPEVIVSLSKPESVPDDLTQKLKEYTEQGYRVLAMAFRILPQNISSYHKLDKLSREVVEKDLNFLGFIVLENRLKPQTIPTIRDLKMANIKVVMATGDNIQTAISVAKECNIISKDDTTIEINLINENVTSPELTYTIVNGPLNTVTSGMTIDSVQQQESFIKDYLNRFTKSKLTTNGKTWSYIREKCPDLLERLVQDGVVFARMTSEQKQQLVLDIQQQGYFVAMCGDGANDCGALKAAHVGISLSEAEASVASPFTSQEANIACVPKIIREGRAALVTSFGIFKFMVIYSLTEFFSTIFLYTIDSNITDFQFLIIDIGFIVNFAFFFGHVKAYAGELVAQTPLPTLLHIIPLSSMLLHLLCIISIQMISFASVKEFSWFLPFTYSHYKDYTSYENYAVYSISQFQYITMVIIFSQGPPYREPIYKNRALFVSIIVMTIVSLYITLYPANWLIKLLQLKYPPAIDFPLLVVLLGFVHILICFFFEEYIVNYLMYKKYRCGIKDGNNNSKSKDNQNVVNYASDNVAFTL